MASPSVGLRLFSHGAVYTGGIFLMRAGNFLLLPVYTALLEDLQQRGLLEETVVLLVSEHGRTPKIGNKPGGAREHWSYAYSGLFAGAGIRQGQVIGATDKQAGYPVERPVNPKDILATLYHLLGFHVETTRTYDSLGRPHFLLPHGQVIPEMLTS